MSTWTEQTLLLITFQLFVNRNVSFFHDLSHLQEDTSHKNSLQILQNGYFVHSAHVSLLYDILCFLNIVHQHILLRLVIAYRWFNFLFAAWRVNLDFDSIEI